MKLNLIQLGLISSLLRMQKDSIKEMITEETINNSTHYKYVTLEMLEEELSIVDDAIKKIESLALSELDIQF